MSATGTVILAPISVGELYDKITILMLKMVHVADPAQRDNVARELEALTELRVSSRLGESYEELFASLLEVNRRLWDVEDELRRLEAAQNFDAPFISLARSVYVLNDERAALKRQINMLSGSWLVEEKCYADATQRATAG